MQHNSAIQFFIKDLCNTDAKCSAGLRMHIITAHFMHKNIIIPPIFYCFHTSTVYTMEPNKESFYKFVVRIVTV